MDANKVSDILHVEKKISIFSFYYSIFFFSQDHWLKEFSGKVQFCYTLFGELITDVLNSLT